jgi:hypothetical protein
MIVIITFEMDFKYALDDPECKTNRTMLSNIPQCNNGQFSGDICTLVEIIIVAFLVTCVVGRWMMPTSKRMGKDAIYIQIAGFTSSAADVVDISYYMQVDEITKWFALMKTAQVVFGVSLTQFCFSLAAVKKRNLELVGFRKFIDILFSTEAWSLILTLFTQELPSFILRIILIETLVSNKDYALYFFVVKNATMIVLLSFRITQLCWHKYKSENKIQPIMDSLF